ncbi:MAG: glycosyltransferase family 39 protein [Candidatus Zixiibacteriota bacterium]|nr:MAG: glycosyltransferase family 39 protein [candidate division Zixibacteria bacterium]
MAVAARLLYLKLASDHLGFEQFATCAFDTSCYRGIGDHILSPHDRGGYLLLRFGPGYGLILAGIKFLFGPNLIWPMLFSILMGGLAPVFVYLLAYELFKSRPVALLAGGFSAVSLTSVALSCHILTDQPFFTLHAAALVAFVHGYLTGRLRWYVLAGLVASYAVYLRPSGQIWVAVFVLLALILPLPKDFRSRPHFIRRAGITGLIMLVMVLGWSVRNYAVHDLFVFGTHGVLTVRSRLAASVAEKTRNENKRVTDYSKAWEQEDGELSENYVAAYGKAKDRIVNEFRDHPWVMVERYLHFTKENMIVGNYFPGWQVPQMRRFMDRLNHIMHWFNYVLMVLTLAGLLVMIRKRQKAAALILGLTYVSFSILLGLTFWQGSRIHYPAEMAWSVIIAYLAVITFDLLKVNWVAWRTKKLA